MENDRIWARDFPADVDGDAKVAWDRIYRSSSHFGMGTWRSSAFWFPMFRNEMSLHMSAKTPANLQVSLRQAIDELQRRHAAGEAEICESVLADFPELHQRRDAVLELIYMEYVLSQEAHSPISAEALQARYPDYQEDLQKILSVDSVFRNAVDTPSPSDTTLGGDLSNAYADQHEERVPLDNLGDYELLEIIGHGGMGVVYRARQRRLNRMVAVKTVDMLSSLNPAAVARFHSEAELVAKLQHPNIVQVYEVGSEHGVPYFSMELVAGGTLAQATRERPLVPVTAAKIVETLARAVHYAHSQSIVHRDLKPANILLAPSDRNQAIELPRPTQAATLDSEHLATRCEVKIADFGLAKFLEGAVDRTATQAMIGTPSYMAPEQIDSALGPVGPAADIYSLGAILYVALTGTPPFNSATAIETVQQVRNSDVIAPSKLQTKIPRDLETICLKCLRKEPSKRYAAAHELADDLQRFLVGQPILARPAGLVERNWKWARRHPSLAALFASVLAASIGMTMLWLRSEHSRRSEQAALQRNDRLLYDRDIGLVQFEYQSNRLERSREILEQTRLDYRGWEWDYLNQQNSRAIGESPKLRNQSIQADISRDGQFVAAGSEREGDFEPEAVHVWNVRKNELLWQLEAEGSASSRLRSLKFSPDGAWLVTAATGWNGKKGGAKLWDLSNGTLRHNLTQRDARVCRFSPDGDYVYVGETRGVVSQFSTETGKLLRKYPCVEKDPSWILDFDFSPDGSRMVVLTRTFDVSLWDTHSGKKLQTLVQEGHPYEIDWSPDGKTVTISNWSGYTRHYRLDADKLTRLSEHWTTREDEQWSADFSVGAYTPDGRRFVSTEFGHAIEIRNVATNRVEQIIPSHNGNTKQIAFDATGRFLMTAGIDSRVRVWDLSVAHRRQVHSVVPRTRISDFAISPAHREMAMAYSQTNDNQPRVEIRDPSSHKVIRQLLGHTQNATCVSYSADGLQLLSGSEDMTVRIWDPATGESLAVLAGHKAPILNAAFSADSQSAASIDTDGVIIVWKLEDNSIARTWKFEGTVQSATVHPLLPIVAVACQGKPVAFWGLDGRQLSQLPVKDETTSVFFSPNGQRLATVGTQGTAFVWGTEGLSRPGSVPSLICELKGHTDAINNISFSPDGQRLVSSCRDQDFRLYDAESGYELIKLHSGRGADGLIHFSPDGKLIVRTLMGIFSTWSNEDFSAFESSSSNQTSNIAWHQTEAASAAKAQDWFAARFHQDQLTKLEPDKPAHWHSRSTSRLMLADFAGAEEDLLQCDGKVEAKFQRGVEINLARAYLGQHKLPQYREICERFFHVYKDSSKPDELNTLLWFGVLDRQSQLDLSIYHSKLEALVKNPKSHLAAYLNTLALSHYRRQEYRQAIDCSSESLRLSKDMPYPCDWMILALSYAQLDQQRTGWLPGMLRSLIRRWGWSSQWNASSEYLAKVEVWIDQQDESFQEGKVLDYVSFCFLKTEFPHLKAEWEEIAGVR